MPDRPERNERGEVAKKGQRRREVTPPRAESALEARDDTCQRRN